MSKMCYTHFAYNFSRDAKFRTSKLGPCSVRVVFYFTFKSGFFLFSNPKYEAVRGEILRDIFYSARFGLIE